MRGIIMETEKQIEQASINISQILNPKPTYQDIQKDIINEVFN